MAGYANRVVTLRFPDLTEEGDQELFVILRNPKTLPPDELVPQDLPVDADGRPIDQDLAAQRSREIIAKLIVGWRMYDATDFGVDLETSEPTDQHPLELPATADLVAKLPTAAIQAINETIVEAVNPS